MKVKNQSGGLILEEAINNLHLEVLLKINAAAICGTDLHIYDWNQCKLTSTTSSNAVGT